MRQYFLHPGARALAAFDDGRDTASPAIRAHLAHCQRCRAVILFHRELATAAALLPRNELPPDLLDRILVERARGERIILPAVEQHRAPTRTRSPLLAAAVLLVVIGATALLTRRGGNPFVLHRGEGFAGGTATLKEQAAGGVPAEAFVSTLSLIRSAEAREPSASPHPTAPPLTHLDGRRMYRGHLEYAQRWTDNAGRQSIDARSQMDIVPMKAGTTETWRIVTSWAGDLGTRNVRLEVETLFVARDDLAPLRRVVHASPYLRYSRINITQRFRGDSVGGLMTSEGADSRGVGRPIAQRLPSAFGPYLSEALSPVFLTSASITRAFRHSVSLLGWAVRDEDVFSSVEMRVVGEERIVVPAGSFDCWRLLLSVGHRRVVYWVRKSDGLGVLSRDDSRRTAKGRRELVLVHLD